MSVSSEHNHAEKRNPRHQAQLGVWCLVEATSIDLCIALLLPVKRPSSTSLSFPLPQGFWRGTVPGLLLVMPYSAIQFVTIHRCKSWLAGSSKDGTCLLICLINEHRTFTAQNRSIEWSLTSCHRSWCPWLTLLVKPATSSHHRWKQGTPLIGLPSSLLLFPPEAHEKLRPELSFGVGAVAGVAATLGSYPFDLLRTVMASQGEPKVRRLPPRH